MSLRWNAIRAALDTKMAAFPGGYPIAWAGETFDQPNAGVWLQPTMIPTTVDHALTASGYTFERGIYQVSVFLDANGGLGTLTAVIDALSNHFDRVALSGVGVTVQCEVPVPGPLMQEPDWHHYPLSIPFRAL